MKKQQALDLLMLLSAFESWSFTTGARIPDYLHDRLAKQIESLSEVVLDGLQ